MTAYVVTAPLVQVSTEPDGVAVQVAKGGTVPSNTTKVALDNLIELGYVEKVAEAKDDGPSPGSAPFILAEVGTDKALAQVALDEENAKENPRKGLVASLQKVIEA